MQRRGLRGSIDKPFIITVKTDNAGTSADNQFTLPPSNPTERYNIKTSDGQSINGLLGAYTITFPTAGTYVIEISGRFDGVVFFNRDDKLKLISVDQWGIYGKYSNNLQNAFYGCSNLLSLADDVEIINLIPGWANVFVNCTSINDLPIGLTLPNLTNGVGTFSGVVINTARFSQLLIDWAALNPNDNVPFNGGGSKYNTAGEIAKNALNARGWWIGSGGLEI